MRRHPEAAHTIKLSAEENSTPPEVLQRVQWIQTLTLIWMSVEAGDSIGQAGSPVPEINPKNISELILVFGRGDFPDNFSAYHGPEHFGVSQFFGWNGHHVAVKEHEIRLFSWRDRSDRVQLVQCTRGGSGVGVQHGIARQALLGIQHSLWTFAGFRLIDGPKYIRGGNGPIAGAGDNSAAIEQRPRRILPLIHFRVQIGFNDFNRVRTCAGPIQLQCTDDTQLAESRKILERHELFVSKGVR